MLLLLLALCGARVSGDTSITCSTNTTDYDVKIVDLTQRSWSDAHAFCRNENLGQLVQLTDSQVTSCITDFIQNRSSSLNSVYEVSWWTGARFDCPSVSAIARGLVTTQGSCLSRKSFICQYGGE